MQKKAGLWLLALILSAALAGCMQSEKPQEGTATETAAGSPSELTGKPSGDAAPSEDGDETASDVGEDQKKIEVKLDGQLTVHENDLVIKGTTDLLPGAILRAYGYNDRTQVLPDGSFTLQFPHPKNSKEYDYHIEVIPENPPWPTVRDAYGPNGEKFEGELVKEKELTSRTVKFLELKVKITE